MKKTRQAFLLLSLLHIFLCLSFQARVTEARLRHLGEAARILIGSKPSICVRPSPPCRAPLSSRLKPCITVPRPPRGGRCSPPKH
ncbi:hypothetical protein EUTSA_v10010867mg [Eutrema salsugineum]|uniref:Uncharacterized protein n=1 Tax=Eutrema salsugineum TaxID=72664 RepID=V4LRW2_EUTSA|nr:hypothetical protein EUTSA_v10010867mg [Eutrema salsugineum]